MTGDDGREGATLGFDQLTEEGLIDSNGGPCTYCREDKPDCRPTCVHGREYVPALCDDCWEAIRRAGRHDVGRGVEVWHGE